MSERSKRAVRIGTSVSAMLAAAVVVILFERSGQGSWLGGDGVRPSKRETEVLGNRRSEQFVPETQARLPVIAVPDLPGRATRQVATSLVAQSPTAGAVKSGAEAQRPLDGVGAAKAIDWDKVKLFGPIPRSMPTAQGVVDAVDAGFVPEWFEHSIGEWRADSSTTKDGRWRTIEVKALASQIMSESKDPGDAWAQGMDSQLRSIIASHSANADVISRVYCNGQGCLCYLESADVMTRPTSDVFVSLRNDP